MTWHKPADCEICSVLETHPTATNAEVKALGGGIWGERTIRRHRNTPRLDDVDAFFNVPTSIITSRGKSTRLADGSWEKVTYRPQDEALLNALKYDDIEKALADYRPPATAVSAKVSTEVLCIADLQVGKVASGGGSKELVDRVMKSVTAFEERVRVTRPGEILLLELGDLVENFSNLSTQRATNDLDMTLQIRIARRLLSEIVKRVAHLAPKVVLVSVPSNHGAVRIEGTKDFASNPNNDWGIEINHQLEEVFSNREGFEHVEFLRTEGHQESLTYTCLDGTVIGVVHGHQASNPTKISDWWKGQSHGRRHGLHLADLLFHGHYHHLSITQTGDERWIIGTPSSDGGSDWFVNKTGEVSTSGMLMLEVSNRNWVNPKIV